MCVYFLVDILVGRFIVGVIEFRDSWYGGRGRIVVGLV